MTAPQDRTLYERVACTKCSWKERLSGHKIDDNFHCFVPLDTDALQALADESLRAEVDRLSAEVIRLNTMIKEITERSISVYEVAARSMEEVVALKGLLQELRTLIPEMRGRNYRTTVDEVELNKRIDAALEAPDA